MKEIMYENEPVKVLEVSGYNDGYYWDYNAKIEFKGETYSLFDTGSDSGYNLCSKGITKCDFDRLYGEEQYKIDECDWYWDCFKNTVIFLLEEFVESCAKETWESREDDAGNTHILIDGIEQK